MKIKFKQLVVLLALASCAFTFSNCAMEGAATGSDGSTDRAAEAAVPSSHLSDRDLNMISR